VKKAFFLLTIFAYGIVTCAASTPTLFFSDLTSGPVGSIVTIYGANLAGTVTLNGVTAPVVASSSTKVSFTVPNTASGSIAMGGSNALPFTVRAGNIWYVATGGSDSNAGTLSAPWATIPHAFDTAAACGDIIYVMNGVSQTGADNYDASLSVQRVCTQAAPLALVGYPGATVTIGSATGQEYGIRNPQIGSEGFNGIVFANLTIRGANNGIMVTGSNYWRIVGNDFSCPNGSGEAACVMMDSASYIQILGNSVHDTGAGGTKYYHSIYGTTNTLHAEVGWNNIYNNKSCRGVQFYSTSGSPQYDLIVHDNIIDGQECDGINFSTVDATQGPIEAYNNLVYHVGLGGATDGTPNYACIASLGYGAAGGQELFYGNTLADCGSAGGSTAGAITVQSGSPATVLTSNLIMQNAGEVVYSPNTDMSLIAATDDVELTNGTAGVVNSSYQPVTGSPALGAGTSYSGMLYDLAGNPRPQSGSQNAGAYVAAGAGTSSNPTATLSTTTISFGSQTMDTTSSMQNVTLSNSGSASLSISSIALGGTNANQFNTSNNCGSSLSAGQSCNIQAQFAPTSAGSMAASIALTTNASNPTQSISLTGTGAAAATPAVTLAPASIAFGNQTVGSTSGSQVITVTNSGTAALTLTGATMSGANASAFNLTNGCGSTLAAGASCAISITFSPASASAMSAVLTLSDNASPSTQTASISGTGVVAGTPAVTLTPASIAFGSETVGSTSGSQAITVKNTGSAALNLSSAALGGANATAFKLTNGCASTLAAGASCTMSVTFNPASAGAMSATLTLTDNCAQPTQTASLTGTGAAASTGTTTTASYSLNNLYFYNIPVNSTSAASTIKVTNTGKANFTISNLSLTGAQPTSFSASSNCSNIAPKGTCTLSVIFKPQVTGANTASLVITSNATGSLTSIPLVGHGY
jgi:hypothetical protein